MKRAIVTGSTGLVGKEVALQLLAEGYEVHGIDNHSREKFFGIPRVDNEIVDAQYHHYDLDITDKTALYVFEDLQIDAIIHCAAQPSHSLANDDPLLDFNTNVVGTHNMLELARNYKGVTFVYLSTTKVFSDDMNEDCVEGDFRYSCPYLLDEQSPTQGDHGIFGVDKLASDLIVQEYGRYYDMNTIVFRPGCITGHAHKGVREHGFLSYLAQCFHDEKEYFINGYLGKQVRDQLHVSDMAGAILQVVANPKTGYYVLGGGFNNSISILEAIQVLEGMTGKRIDVKFMENRKADHIWNVHDNTKFQKAYPEWRMTKNLYYILNDLI